MLYPSNNVNKIIYRIIWVTQKNTEVVENRALKKEELKEKIKKNNIFLMHNVEKIRSASIWIFILPFVAINVSLILINEFQWLFPNQEDIIHNSFPYFDGGASISRVVRPYPNWLIFKPAMFLTSFLLIKYWIYTKEIVKNLNPQNKHVKKMFYFGMTSAIALIIHTIFLGIHFDNDLYKLFRRVIMLLFIVFEITAQTYLVIIYYSINSKLKKYINQKYLKIKLILVIILITVAVICIPIISWPGQQFKFLKHLLEWDYFLGVITFYLLSFFMWKKIKL